MKLRFQKDGTFKIMQITDMQEIPAISKDTIALMERAVLEEQPDLVVYTGDQIKGYGVTYKGKGEELEREVRIRGAQCSTDTTRRRWQSARSR